MFLAAQFRCCGGDQATLANQEELLAASVAILAAIAALETSTGGGAGDATEAKQDQILDLLKAPQVC